VHTVNEHHVAVAPLRSLLDPVAALTDTVRTSVGDQVEAMILFGSIARGEADSRSDVDLAVIAPAGWDGRTDLEDAVRTRLGNNCDVLAFTHDDFTRLAARSFLTKAEEYLASAEANLAAGRHSPAAGDAIHAGISSKDAVVTALTGTSSKGQDHATAARELEQALGQRTEAATAAKALRELLSAKAEVEYSVALETAAKAEPLLRRARSLVGLQATSSAWGARREGRLPVAE
jgi:predicted nucleotidyltransferase